MKLDSAHLELLAALSTHGTLSAASRHINLSPSAASRRLDEAERRLGLRLVTLEGRSLQLTAAGRLLAETAIRTSREIGEAELAARWFESGDHAPVRVGLGFFDHLSWLLPPLDTHPFEVVRSPTPLASEASKVDIAVDVAARVAADQTVVVSDELVLVASPGHELASRPVIEAKDLAAHRYFASRPEALPGFELEAFFLPAGHGPTRIMRVESFAIVVDLISRGSGVSIQPRRAVSSLGRQDVLIVPLAVELEVHWCVRVHSPSAQVEAFVDALGVN